MQLNRFIFYFLALCASTVFAKERKPNNLVNDLKSLSGSYNLEKGNPIHCPDGEVTASDDALALGANLRIENINKSKLKEVKSGQSACSAESTATFNGKELKYVVVESCEAGSSVKMTYKFELFQSQNTQYISLKYLKGSNLPKSHKSTFSFECLYSRELK